MDGFEPKKLALIRIWQILKDHSDCDHPLTQEDIAAKLENEYGITLERKAVSRNISLLREAGVDIESSRAGSYIESREFEDSELRLLIDSVLSSRHITAKHSLELINKLCNLTNRYFRSHVKNIYSVNDWSKTENPSLFYNIEIVDTAIEQGIQVSYSYNKYGIDKDLHKTSSQIVSPYQLILHNQRYYLMAYSEYWGNMVFHRLDRITDMRFHDKKAVQLRTLTGYENGIDYKKLSSAMPYMYTDEPAHIEFIADEVITDDIIDWFGHDIFMEKAESGKLRITLKASPNAMKHWAMQYIDHVEILRPESLRDRIRQSLETASQKYSNDV